MDIDIEKTALKPRLVDQAWFSRALEIFPGALSWLFLLMPIVLSLAFPIGVAFFIIAFDLSWMMKSFRMSFYLIRGYRRMHEAQQVNWLHRLKQLHDIDSAIEDSKNELLDLLEQYPEALKRFGWGQHATMRRRYKQLHRQLDEWQILSERRSVILDPNSLYQAVIVATYNETRDILEPTIESLTKANYPAKQIILLIAYEARGGDDVEQTAKDLVEQYGDRFAFAAAIKHPENIPGEIKGKGGNITYTARRLTEWCHEQQIDPEHVIVTTLDADNRPDPQYFAYLSFAYATNPNRIHKSFQPVPMFLNNIWDAPAPMRVIATGSSFWMIIETMRPHRLRNFSAHAQSLRALVDTDYWSVTSIVEDGHQFWRTYFAYDGDHQVVPIYVPVFQDAVLAESFKRTFKAQYLQLRRWAWGVSDIPFVIKSNIRNNRVPLSDKIVQTIRLIEGHFSWATAPLILTFTAWLPLILNRHFGNQLIAHQLPVITGRLLTITLAAQIVTIFISLLSLPPRPERYGRMRFVNMVAQWILLPVTAIIFGAFAAMDAQTRLMFGRYLDFRVTEKVKK